MLFISTLQNFKSIPQSFKKVIISEDESCKNISDSLVIESLIPPKSCIDMVTGEVVPNRYLNLLEDVEMYSMIVLLMLGVKNGKDIVILSTRKENRSGFLDILANFIESEFDYPVYDFTGMDNITLEMRHCSNIDDYLLIKLEDEFVNCKPYIDKCVDKGMVI